MMARSDQWVLLLLFVRLSGTEVKLEEYKCIGAFNGWLMFPRISPSHHILFQKPTNETVLLF
jgi:hypothetical protein